MGYSASQLLWRKPEPSHALCILVQEPFITVITMLEGVQGFQPLHALHLSYTSLCLRLKIGLRRLSLKFFEGGIHIVPPVLPVKWVSTKIRSVPSWCNFALFSQFCSPWANRLDRSGVYLVSVKYKRRVGNYTETAHCAHGKRSAPVQTATKPVPCLHPSLALNDALNLDTAQG